MPKGNEINGMEATPAFLFTVVVFTIAKKWEQLQYPFTDECTKTRWPSYIVEYHSVIKRMKC